MVKKHYGRDAELSTTGIDAQGHSIDPGDVTREILSRIPEACDALGLRTWNRDVYWRQHASGSAFVGTAYRDFLRNWLSNGACVYPDMGHVEICSAASWHPRICASQTLALLMIAEEARSIAEAQSDDGNRYRLSTSNVDAGDPATSFGTHGNIAVAEALWEDLFVSHRHPALLGLVASGIAAAIPFFGAGYLLPLKDGTTIYSLSGRAHHLNRTITLATTQPFQRGLLNSRREAHGTGHDRMHLIGFDLPILSEALQCAYLQCLLSAAEDGFCRINLYDPVRATQVWSWGLNLLRGTPEGRALLTDGRQMTLPQFIRAVTSELLQMFESGLFRNRVAPECGELLALILDLTRYAEEGSLLRCARHLTWAAKLLYLMDFCATQKATLGDVDTRLADHDFICSDRTRGPFWRLWEEDLVDPLVSMDDVRACLTDGPAEARGWGRGRLIRQFGVSITDVDWSYVELAKDSEHWGPRLRVEMPALSGSNRSSLESILPQARSVADLESLLKYDTTNTDPFDRVADQLAIPNR